MPFGLGYGIAIGIVRNHFRASLSSRFALYEEEIVSPTLGYLSALTCFNPERNSSSYHSYTYEDLHPESKASKPQYRKR